MTRRCERCERPCAAWNARPDQIPPGHVRYKGRGLCNTCHRIEARRLNPPRRPCTECGLVRQVRNGRTGLCIKCFNAEFNRPKVVPCEPDDEPESPRTLKGGRWTPNGRGILVWREDTAA
jgi:hypothetical protein